MALNPIDFHPVSDYIAFVLSATITTGG